MTQRQRRKLSAVDDPLKSPSETLPAAAALRPAVPADRVVRAGGADRQALFVRLPALEADSLARAAFELRLHKREIVAALIAQHVDARSADGLASVKRLVEEYRDARG